MSYKTIGNNAQLLRRIGYDGSWKEFDEYCSGACKNVGGIHYNISEIPKPKNPSELRIIEAPKIKLKRLQSNLYRYLRDRIDFAECVHGGVQKRSYITNAALHINSKHFFLVDILKFYPSVSARKVHSELLSFATPEIANVLTKLVTLNGHVPTGSPFSQFASNLVLRNLDKKIKVICQRNNLTYSRYIDDLTVSGKVDFAHGEVPDHILKAIQSEGFKHKARKTKYQIGSAEITGVLVIRCRLQPTQTTLNKLASMLNDPDKEASRRGLALHVQNIAQANKWRVHGTVRSSD